MNKQKILVIEDEIIIAVNIQNILEKRVMVYAALAYRQMKQSALLKNITPI